MMKSINHFRIATLWLLLCGTALSTTVVAQDVSLSSSAASGEAQAAGASSSISTNNGLSPGVSTQVETDSNNRGTVDRDADDRDADDRELVNVGSDSNLPAGERAATVVSVLGSVTSAGEVSDDVVAVFGNTRVTGPVGHDVVAVLGNVYVNNKVGHDVVAVLGNVELGPLAHVEGEIVAVGGRITRDPAAVVQGGVQSLGLGMKFGGFDWLRPWIDNCLLYARPLALAPGLSWAWTLALLALLSYVVTALLAPRAVIRCVTTLETHPGHSLLAALLATLLTPVLFILLVITVIGIVAIPFLAMGLLCLSAFGKLVMLTWIGRRITRYFGEGMLAHVAVATLVGGLIVTALYLVPGLGFVMYKLLGFVGFGVVVYTLMLHFRSKRQTGATSTGGSVDGWSGNAGGADSASMAQAPGEDISSSAYAPASDSAVHLSSLPRASFWIRMGALALDVLLVWMILSLVHDAEDILLLSLAAYGALMWKFKGTTIGGIVFGLRVMRIDERELDWPTVIVRALGCFLSLVVAGLGFIWIAIGDERQAWHDKIAGTMVVRVPKGMSLV